MVPRHSEDRPEVVLVRLVVLGIIFRDLPIEIDAVAEHVEKGRVHREVRRVRHEVLLEPLCDPLLWHRKVDSAQIASDMEA